MTSKGNPRTYSIDQEERSRARVPSVDAHYATSRERRVCVRIRPVLSMQGVLFRIARPPEWGVRVSCKHTHSTLVPHACTHSIHAHGAAHTLGARLRDGVRGWLTDLDLTPAQTELASEFCRRRGCVLCKGVSLSRPQHWLAKQRLAH
jgi:hypothetical protein